MLFQLFNLASLVKERLGAVQNERGATAVEYGLLVALIAGVIIAIVTTLGTQIAAAFQTVVDQLPGGDG